MRVFSSGHTGCQVVFLRGLKPGDVWYHKLEFELESSDVMVLVVSEKVRTSKWVHNEVSMAEDIGIPVIPVLAEKVRHPLWLRHLQVLDFCEELHWASLLGAIGHHVGGSGGTRGISPPWASNAGSDSYGHYADLNVQGVWVGGYGLYPSLVESGDG
ncbi:MAG TPA: toll/interleukin-1 receptor domain-containing protein [Candidatus Thiothrix moscowensis]|uniref:toll/interleukin-1 receptor domain-containing protein n=1 Tax=unclassified Thiothrix TaxID=2636184 RepID=UPI0025E6C316|nr:MULTISPECIES: toll/interleukin-1 receptor domain-containing protein [unclassified Thiothrix]HRJ51455.1 toll/interleukin-1 receptor domain-containing protein [Candidatus Thiothrix moscowensis]HRJ91490.1 toll/interleukin-1 receptor domain-containing protein [Candidatus Thiothrix moscowensis]